MNFQYATSFWGTWDGNEFGEGYCWWPIELGNVIQLFVLNTFSWWFAKLDRHAPCSINEGSNVRSPRKKHLLHAVIHRIHLVSKHWEGTVYAQHHHTVYRLIHLKSQTSLWYWLSETFLLKRNLCLFVMPEPGRKTGGTAKASEHNLGPKDCTQTMDYKKKRIFAQGCC